MATFSFGGLDSLMDDLASLAELPDSVVNDMLEAEASVIVQAQRNEIETQWSGPNSLGISARCVKKGKVKKTKDGHTIDVFPQGKRTRGKATTRNAEIAFINEYGSSGIGRKKNHQKRTEPKRVLPRPAIRTANAKAENAAVAAGEKVLHDYMDQHNL